ncbi:MAG: outer membrane beta-barrel protein [Muribaculaceae bacterium]|nr:outer membrane beta-barrel protein [Muribaculaceae bacterium]
MFHLIKRLMAASVLLAAALLPLSVSAQEHFSRGLQQSSFIPKGQWITGISVNYDQNNLKNYQFLIVEDLQGKSYSFKISPQLMYAIADNLAVGGKFAYQRSYNNMESGTVKLDSETTYDIDHLNTLSNNYFGMGVLRYYISFGTNTRFALFNELQLQLGGGETRMLNGSGDDFTGTLERNFQARVGLAPGMVMFLNNYSALEVNVGVLGFGYTRTKATTDHVYVSHRHTKDANFKVNLFSITFGVAFYL